MKSLPFMGQSIGETPFLISSLRQSVFKSHQVPPLNILPGHIWGWCTCRFVAMRQSTNPICNVFHGAYLPLTDSSGPSHIHSLGNERSKTPHSCPISFSDPSHSDLWERHTASQQYGLIVSTDLHWHHAAALKLCVPARTGTRGMISELERNISSK